MRTEKIVGRSAWVSRLRADLPHVTLLRAPASTGKRTVALAAASHAGVGPADCRVYPAVEYQDEYGRVTDPGDDRNGGAFRVVEPELTITHAREIISWARTAPLSSPFKVAIVRLDHVRGDGSAWRASSRTLAAMLKVLEEPPASTRFVLLATTPTMPMVRSRAVEMTAGLLSPEQVAEVVYAVSDLSEHESKRVAALGGGRVAPSLALSSGAEGSVQAAVDVVCALSARDRVALAEKSRVFSDSDAVMLVRWAHERLTGRYVIFADSGVPEVPSVLAERILRLVRTTAGARPRLLLGALAAMDVM